MQYESYNYNNFIFFFAKNFYPNNFIFTLDSLIKYLMNIKDKQTFINKLNIFIYTKSISL
jgi:hypothetical protein